MRGRKGGFSPKCGGIESDWEFFLPDEEETYPEPGDFWIDDDCDDEF